MRLAILGASGHGKVVADAAEQAGWKSITFFDDAWPKFDAIGPWSVEGNSRALIAGLRAFDGVVVGIGNNRVREEKQLELEEARAKFVSIVHPSATISPHTSVGEGSVVLANSVVNPFAVVGAGVIVNTGAVVEHDCIVGDFVHVSPNAVLAGGVSVGNRSWIGAGASLRQSISVGNGSIIGMGAVVTKDIESEVIALGNPARVRRR